MLFKQLVKYSLYIILYRFNLIFPFVTTYLIKSDDCLTPTDLTTTLLIISWSFIIIFSCSELGETMAFQFNVFHELLCQSNWYEFSIDMQRMLIIFMLDTQQLAFIRGYGNIVCTRDAFKNVNIFLEKINFDF